ncbi:MAG: glycosyl hydrolase family 18 protein, partial [Planctomycetota bacterium]
GVGGLNIDFEGFEHSDWVPYFPGFIAELGGSLYPQFPGLRITIATPAVDWSGRWDFRALADASDGLFIMGYDYYGSWSTTSGPSAPLIGPYTSVTETVREEYAAVLSQTPDKLILGVPWYGNDWTTTSGDPYAPVTRWNEHPYYHEAMSLAGIHGPILWDDDSETSWIRWPESGRWRQVWFDSPESLGRKFDLALNEGLAGVGMWALGYDGGREEIWDEVADRVAAACLRLAAPDPGRVGVTNHFEIRGGQPGATIYLAWGDAYGDTAIAACAPGDGLALRIGQARLVGSAVVDSTGLATLSRLVPAAAADRDLLFQAVEPATCSVSNLQRVRFEQ